MNCFLFFSSWSLKHWKLLRVLTYGYAKIQKFKEIEKHSVNIKIFANFLWRAWIVLNSSNKTAVEATQGKTKLPAIYREDFLWPPPPPLVLLLVCERSFCPFSFSFVLFFFKVEDSLSLLILRLLFPYLNRMCNFFVYTKLSRTLFCYFFDTIASHSTVNYTEKDFIKYLEK